MHNTLSFILAITVLPGLCDASCNSTSFDDLSRATIPFSWRSKPIEIINIEKNAYLCRNYDCRVISHESLSSRLPGTFFNITDYSNKSGLRYVRLRPLFAGDESPKRSIRKRSAIETYNPCSLDGTVSDGDYCCPTTRYFTCFTTPTEINNINNQLFNVFALSNSFQCVTYAACCGGGTCSQNGRSCRLEGSKQSLFTWHEPSGFLRFEMFEFPAYCACKSN